MVLIYPGPLPEGALVRRHEAAPPAPLWLDARSGAILSEAGRVLGWQAKDHPATAVPVPANTTGTEYQDHGLHFVAGENGGLVLADAVPDLASLTLGAILSPNLPEARTLLSLKPATSDDYIFLSLEGMCLRLAQRGAESELTLTLPPDSMVPLLVLCSFSRGQARLSVNGGAVETGALALASGAADLFIGCRTAKAGMKNKLGSFDLTDVLVWPGEDLLQAALPRALTNLWDDRCRLDL